MYNIRQALVTRPHQQYIYLQVYNPIYYVIFSPNLLCEWQVLEVVRSNYDTLTLKLQDGLDQYERYSEQHKEATFFKELVSLQ